MYTRINLLASLIVVNLLSFAQTAVASEGVEAAVETAKGGGSLTARTSIKRGNEPVGDLSSMTREELEARVLELTAKQSDTSTHSFRFNDGSDPTYYEAGEKMFGGGIAKGGEVKSARDTGSISIYGFGRQPISLFPNQLLELAQVLTNEDGVVAFIVNNEETINEYLRTRSGFKADRLIRVEDAKGMLASWGHPCPEVDAEGIEAGAE